MILPWPGYSISLSIAAAISCRNQRRRLVIDLSGINHVLISRPATMAKVLFHALVATGDLFRCQAGSRIAQGIPGAGRAPEGVGRLNDHGFDRDRLDFVVVGFDRVMIASTSSYRRAGRPHRCVGSLDFMAHCLADVVAGPPTGNLNRRPQFGRHQRGRVWLLDPGG